MMIDNAVVKKVGRDYDREVVECAMDLLQAQKTLEKKKAKNEFWQGFAMASFAYSVAREAGRSFRDV